MIRLIPRESALEAMSFSWPTIPVLFFAISASGCDHAPPDQTLESLNASIPSFESEELRGTPAEANAAPGLYSSLTGKMARMEELLNAIDRFLDIPDLHDRVLADAKEFDRLLAESRGLYPERLLTEDEPGFDKTIDRTGMISSKLLSSIQAGDNDAAREALRALDEYRLKAHTRFSY